jgi:hypothetical protein
MFIRLKRQANSFHRPNFFFVILPLQSPSFDPSYDSLTEEQLEAFFDTYCIQQGASYPWRLSIFRAGSLICCEHGEFLRTL